MGVSQRLPTLGMSRVTAVTASQPDAAEFRRRAVVKMLTGKSKVAQPKRGAREDDNKVVNAHVRLSGSRLDRRSVRARPGTFEWRYGRKSADAALYHGGVMFASLWEIAGTASARSPDFSATPTSSGWKGLPDARAVAMDKLRDAVTTLGKASTSRLQMYCVDGKTCAEIARAHGETERTMAPVLHVDLRACAQHFRCL